MILHSFQHLMKYIEIHSLGKDTLGILTSKVPAETKIFLFILFELEGKCLFDWENLAEEQIYRLMYIYFYIFNIDKYSPLIIKSSVVGNIKDYKDFIKSDVQLNLRYISSIEGLKPRNMFKYFFDRLFSKFRKMTNEY